MATIVVTGACGFIGWKVCELLLAQNVQVWGLDNLNSVYDVRLKQWRLGTLEAHQRFSFHNVDICDRRQLAGLFASGEIEAVVNLAARAGVRQSVEDPWIYLETNVNGNLNLLELCRTHHIKKFVLASTSSLYGDSSPRPFREKSNTDEPLSPYAASKKSAEAWSYTYHYLYGLDVTVLRFFTVYGPAGRPDMSLFRFVQRITEGRPIVIFGDGLQERDFTYVDDIARGVVAALRPIGYEILNLGSNEPVVLRDAIRLIEKLVGRPAEVDYRPRHPSDVLATWADIERARQRLEWYPRTSFAEGLGRLVDWYRENRDWAKDVNTS